MYLVLYFKNIFYSTFIIIWTLVLLYIHILVSQLINVSKFIFLFLLIIFWGYSDMMSRFICSCLYILLVNIDIVLGWSKINLCLTSLSTKKEYHSGLLYGIHFILLDCLWDILLCSHKNYGSSSVPQVSLPTNLAWCHVSYYYHLLPIVIVVCKLFFKNLSWN